MMRLLHNVYSGRTPDARDPRPLACRVGRARRAAFLSLSAATAIARPKQRRALCGLVRCTESNIHSVKEMMPVAPDSSAKR